MKRENLKELVFAEVLKNVDHVKIEGKEIEVCIPNGTKKIGVSCACGKCAIGKYFIYTYYGSFGLVGELVETEPDKEGAMQFCSDVSDEIVDIVLASLK